MEAKVISVKGLDVTAIDGDGVEVKVYGLSPDSLSIGDIVFGDLQNEDEDPDNFYFEATSINLLKKDDITCQNLT